MQHCAQIMPQTSYAAANDSTFVLYCRTTILQSWNIFGILSECLEDWQKSSEITKRDDGCPIQGQGGGPTSMS